MTSMPSHPAPDNGQIVPVTVPAAPCLQVDVAICGAGPAGSALALLLAQTGPAAARVVLIDGRPAPATDPVRQPADPRLIAIAQGSRTILERVGAWRAASATPIERIHVSQRGRFGRTLIDRSDYAVPALGYVIAYADLQAQLDAACTAAGSERLQAVRATAIEPVAPASAAGNAPGHGPAARATGTAHSDARRVLVTLDDGRVVQARFVVHAEGGLFNTQAVRPLHRDYGQHALIAIVQSTLPQAGVAFERFTPDGPIALLPVRQGAVNAYSLVWCGTAADTARRLDLDDAAFLAELHDAFGDRVGAFTAAGPRQGYPLGLNAVRDPVSANGLIYAIGNAAQTLHPVAGQGLNLALRDAWMLADALRDHGATPAVCAAAYGAARRRDRRATIGITDLLPRVFASRLAPVVAARGAALAVLDLLPPARHWLARQMMDGQR